MDGEIGDRWLLAFVSTTMLVSLATCLLLVAKWIRGPLLAYEPRRQVPWGAVGAVLALLFVSMAIVSAVALGEQKPTGELPAIHAAERPAESIPSLHLVMSQAPEVLLVGGVLGLFVVYLGAGPRDLGLPSGFRVLAYDVGIGIVAGVAALAPTLLLQGMLMRFLGSPPSESGHPLVSLLRSGKPDVALMVVGAFIALVIAPVCEEFMFRVMLQGWLERWEAGVVRKTAACLAGVAGVPVEMAASDRPVGAGEGGANIEGGLVMAWVEERPPSEERPPPVLGVFGWPYGLFPIAVSAVLFGLAHFGYGPDPIPLFGLGLVLGYLYQRTHRVVPCMVAHAVFNAYSMVALWRMVFAGEG
ncbi:MAG: CPBP family intramembrane metalloprotease [Pirellulales bacterium]|nr:CPBP family intramembrane metalloprotease [Pirellulales bacterium]